MARILGRGITLVYPYSGNKSDYKDTVYFSCCFQNGIANENTVE